MGNRLFYVLLWACVTFPEIYSWSLNKILMTGPKAHLTFSESVAAGAQLGAEECRHQFIWDRWNCPHQMFTSNSMPKAIRETAFVHAISSAGVMHTLTRNCSKGDFENCGCDTEMNGQKNVGSNWDWGGCSDNVKFGERISKQFVDALETGQDTQAAINFHNNEAGRKAVYKTLKVICKCHGVSGSCATKTCWRQLAEFREIGDFLKKKFSKSIQVDYQNGKLQHGRNQRALSAISRSDLIYLEKSPDYCRVNITSGLYGTIGRECSRPKGKSKENRHERRSCNRICTSCGLKVRKHYVQVRQSCNCKFHWCCAVKCEECVQTVLKLTCMPKGSSKRSVRSARKSV